MGLAISRQFVQLMGGGLAVTSQPGQGTVFTFTIRAERAEAIQVKDQLPYRRVVGLAPNQHTPDGGAYRLLIAEDNEFSRLLLQRLLESLNAVSDSHQTIEVQSAVHGQDALETVRAWRPHLIFMDMRMPVMNGYEATKRIRAWERQEEIFDKMAAYLGMQFVYEEEDTAKGERQKVKDKREITSQALTALPPTLLAKLEYAANRNHMQHIAAIIKDIRLHDAAVADALQTLADEFDYDTILHRIHEAKASDDIS